MSDPAVFLLARNPDPASHLPYLIRIGPGRDNDLKLAAALPWPRERDVYCHPLESWPESALILEEVPVILSQHNGRSLLLILDRPQHRRCLFVWTQSPEGRTLIFWRSSSSMRRRRSRIPPRSAPAKTTRDVRLPVAVDHRERYPWQFTDLGLAPYRTSLSIGDYALMSAGRILCAIERKRTVDLVGGFASGHLALQIAELATLERALIVVEDSLPGLLRLADAHGSGSRHLLDRIARVQAEYPMVPWWFADSRATAERAAASWLHASGVLIGYDSLAESPSGGPATEPGRAPSPEPEDPALSLLKNDTSYRRAWAVLQAQTGVVWTARTLAERTGIDPKAAGNDLAQLAQHGALLPEGRTRARTYRAPHLQNGPEEAGPSSEP